MANHTTSKFIESKVCYTSSGGLELTSPSTNIRSSYSTSEPDRKRGLRKGDEVFITYGSHSNSNLFSEYGFVLPSNINERSTSSDYDGNQYNEVKIDEEIEEILNEMNKDELEGIRKKILLQDRGYWGDYTLHWKIPSHRVVVALRLMSIDLSIINVENQNVENRHHNNRSSKRMKKENDTKQTSNSSLDEDENDLYKWEQTLLGLKDEISEENEKRARELLLELCEKVERRNGRSREKYRESEGLLVELKGDGGMEKGNQERERRMKDWEESQRMVGQILDEELEIVKSVRLNLQDEW